MAKNGRTNILAHAVIKGLKRQRLLLTTQVIKTSKVLSIIATVSTQIVRQLTTTMICELKSLPVIADLELLECPTFESVG